ncbi:hypothetical protein CBOM_08122 [Ceraceosorus bombacis]|uniref:Uncharacterized protein n=1 Tax=Ceraceosorus bombacis TaxID=401625 RepID=A0A0P1B7U1_9BASI|nr:hypothetical protein CBOM_08122 [Ceraceosorus bombacis]
MAEDFPIYLATRRSTRICTVYLIVGTLGTVEARLFSRSFCFLTSLFNSTCPSPGRAFCLRSHAGLITCTRSTIPFALAAPPSLHPFDLKLMIFPQLVTSHCVCSCFASLSVEDCPSTLATWASVATPQSSTVLECVDEHHHHCCASAVISSSEVGRSTLMRRRRCWRLCPFSCSSCM